MLNSYIIGAPSAAMPTYQGEGAVEASLSGSITPAWPTSHQSDDIGVIVVENYGLSGSPSVPSGYTAHPISPIVSDVVGGNATRLWIVGKRATSSSEASPTITGLSNHGVGRILTIRGVRNTGDWWDPDVYASSVEATDVTAVSFPGETTTGANRLIMLLGARGNDTSSTAEWSGYSNSDLANITERWEAGTALGNGGGLVCVTGEKAVAGAFGVTTATLANASKQALACIAFRP